MNRCAWLLSGAVIAASLAGCSPAESTGPADTTTDTGGGDVLDARVAEPDADPAYVDFVTPEFEVPSGEERMMCYHFELEEDVTANNLEAYQGQFGHHIVLLTPKEPKPAGTAEDCTDRSTMAKYGPFVLPSTELPEGYGIQIPKGTKVVLQAHYVNAGSKPLLARDVARLHKVPLESVTTWVQMLASSDNTLELPPQQKSTVAIDCALPAGVELLVFGGHMHERGTRFEALLGKDESSMESIYLVDPWLEEYRDAPPVSLFFKNPLKIAEPSILRAKCDWNNESPDTLTFPEEMCATFGYVTGSDSAIECVLNVP